MKNGLILLAIILSVALFGGMMRIKTDVQTMTRERARLANEKIELRETKRVLEAELAHMASPLRLQELAKQRNYIALTVDKVEPMITDTAPVGFVVSPETVE